MGRHVVSTMNRIFDVLKTHVSEDDSHHIVAVNRHIRAEGDEKLVVDFVKSAKMKTISCYLEVCSLFEYREQRYLLIPDKYAATIQEIGLEIELDSVAVQGTGMLAMASGELPLAKGILSAQVINLCLGILPEDISKNDIEFQFSELRELFMPYCVVRMDDSRFSMAYVEDINRLIGYLLADVHASLDESTKGSIKSLLLLKSSRSIAGSVLNGIQNPLIEYTFLQMYQCIEYLFRLNNCFTISSEHGIALGTSMDIVLSNEFKKSESENLLQILRNYAEPALLEVIVDLSLDGGAGEVTDVFQKATSYIYKLRCNIAHLRYNQDDLSNVKWAQCVNVLIEVVLSIYQKCDENIISVCDEKEAWSLFTMDN